jgi:serine/threonine protein phosphatase PrpC
MVLPVPADAAAKGLSIRHTVVTYADGQTQSVQIVRDGLRAPFRLLLGNAPELLARITTLEYQVFLDGIYIERHLSDISAQIRDHHPGQPKAIEMARFAIDRERAQYALPRWLAQASPSNLTAAGIEDLSVYGSAIYRAMGNRETQEDRAGARFVDLPLHEDTVRCQFTYVLDGHNGPGCAEHGIRTIAQLVQRRVLQFQAYEGTIALVNGLTLGTVDCSYSYAAPAGGTTFNGALRIGKTLLVANVGDCRSLLVYPDARFVQCSRDHEPMLCRREIEQRGGKIGRNPECELEVRVNRYLNFGRALGNNTVGRGALSARAEVTRNTIEGPAYLVQFTDGLSSFATNGDVAHYVAQHFREGAHAIAAGLCHSANQVALAHAKAANEDADNVTVVVTPYFMPWKQPLLSTPQKV